MRLSATAYTRADHGRATTGEQAVQHSEAERMLTVKHPRSFRPHPHYSLGMSLECCSRGVTLHPSIHHTHPQEEVTAPCERRWRPAPRPWLAEQIQAITGGS